MLLSRRINGQRAPSTSARSAPALLPARIVVCHATPSSAPAASELQLLQHYTQVVPDVAPTDKQTRATAATVSFANLTRMLGSESLGLKPFQSAIIGAVNWDGCDGLPEVERADGKLDKAIVNVGSLYSKEVEGRVCTDIDARLANDTEAMVKKVSKLADMYTAAQVPADKTIFRLPATWAGIQAAKQLEAKGITTQVYLVYSMAQAVAAAQAGVSVIQPNLGRIRDCWRKFPNAPTGLRGGEGEAAFISSQDPGLMLVLNMSAYVKKFHPKTKVMVSGVRSKDDALALSGVDFMILPSKVISDLASSPTVAGYNDDLRGGGNPSIDEGQAMQNAKAAMSRELEQMDTFSQESFNEAVGFAASELLKASLAQHCTEAAQVLPLFMKGTTAHSAT